MRGSSSGTASLLSDSVDRLPVVLDEGASFWERVAPSNEPVPYEQRWQFWVRTRERLRQRRAERQEQRDRESQDISLWLAEKAPTATEVIAQDTVDRITSYLPPDKYPTIQDWAERRVVIVDGEASAFEFFAQGMDPWNPAPISSARSTRRQVEVLDTIDVDEVFWDLASMIDAHRNGATALDSERPVRVFGEPTPVWDELTRIKWDPTHEMGPRERQYVRKLAKS